MKSGRIKVLVDATSLTNDMTGVTRYGLEIFKTFTHASEFEFSFLISNSLKKDHSIFNLFREKETKFYRLKVKGIGPVRELKLILFKITTRPQYDIFHCLTTNAPFAFKKKSLVTIHDLKYLKYPHYLGSMHVLKSWFLKAQIFWAIKFYSRLICISKSTLNDLMEVYPNDNTVIKDKSRVLLNGLSPLKLIQNYCSPLEFPKEYFLYIGELRPHKNINNIVEAFKHFKNVNDSDVKFIIVGKKHPSFNLDLNHKDIILMGAVNDSDLPLLYNRSLALVFPSLYEGFGLPIIEAMDLGTPVITSNISSMPEVAGTAAILVNPHSIEEIVQAMIRISSDHGLREDLIMKGKQRASEFSWQHTANSLLEIYKEIYLSPHK